jgi:hypothetical protein
MLYKYQGPALFLLYHRCKRIARGHCHKRPHKHAVARSRAKVAVLLLSTNSTEFGLLVWQV